MPQIVSCPTCGFRSQVPDHLVGQDVRCPKCKKIIAGNSSVSQSPQIMAGETYAHGTKPCPYCAMAVPLEAKKCRHCGETIDVTLSKAEAALRAAERAADLAGKHGPINVNTNVHAAGGAASSSSSAAASSSAVASRSGGFPLAWIFAAIGGAFVVFCILPCCGLQLLSVSKNPIPDSNRPPTPSQKLAKLQIKIDGSNNLQGVELFVDGNLQKSLNRQMTLQLPEGTHSLELKVNGEKRWSDSVKVNPSSQGDTYVTVPSDATEPSDLPGTLTLTIPNPPNKHALRHVELFIDDKLERNFRDGTGDNPWKSNIQLRPGSHKIKVLKNGIKVKEEEVQVKKPGKGNTFITLEFPVTGTVIINSQVPPLAKEEVFVFVDGNSFKQWPVAAKSIELTLEVGDHQLDIQLRQPGTQNRTLAQGTIQVLPAQSKTLTMGGGKLQ